MESPRKPATLIYRHDLNATLAVFRLALDGGVPEFRAGQSVRLGLPIPEDGGNVTWRDYSIASPPEQKDHLELFVRLPDKPSPAKFTTQLWKTRVGESVLWQTPAGSFTIDDRLPDGSPDRRRMVLVASGTGLAPFIAYAAHLRHVGSKRQIVVLHGARSVDELGYREFLLDLEKHSVGEGRRNWNFHYVATISRPKEPRSAGWTGHVGRVETLLRGVDGPGSSPAERVVGEAFTRQNSILYVCGYADTIKTVVAEMLPRGFLSCQVKAADGSYDIKFESYG